LTLTDIGAMRAPQKSSLSGVEQVNEHPVNWHEKPRQRHLVTGAVVVVTG